MHIYSNKQHCLLINRTKNYQLLYSHHLVILILNLKSQVVIPMLKLRNLVEFCNKLQIIHIKI